MVPAAWSFTPAPGKWNDYGDAHTVLGFPLYGVAEISPASTLRLSLPVSLSPTKPQAVANPLVATTVGPELRAFTAMELSWLSETNKRYQVQWTASLDRPQWTDLEPPIWGTGTNLSVFSSTREHPHGFYQVRVVK